MTEPLKKSFEEHRQIHIRLHRHLDELLADWIDQTESMPSKSTVTELIKWSYQQTINPVDKRGEYEAKP